MESEEGISIEMEKCATDRQSDHMTAWQVNKNVLEVNQYILEKQIRCDVVFQFPVAHDVRLGAHSLILMSRSPVFDETLADKTQTNAGILMKIDDIKYDTFCEFLKYIYYEQCTLTPANVLPLRYAARKYVIPQLVELASRYVDQNITVENVCTIFQKSLEFAERELEQRCLAFICENASSVLQAEDLTSLEHDALLKVVESDVLFCDGEMVVYNACVNWARKKCEAGGMKGSDEEVREMLGPVLFQVRLPMIDIKEIASLLGNTSIVTDEEKGALYTYAFTQATDPTLRFSAKPRAYQTKRVSRFSSSMKPTSTNHNNCRVHSLTFRVDKKILMIGTTLISCQTTKRISPGTLTITGPKDMEASTKVNEYQGVDTIDVSIKPLVVTANTDHVLTFTYDANVANATTFQMYKGSHSSYAPVTGHDVTFTFSNSSVSNNGTTFQHGQFHEILFDTCN